MVVIKEISHNVSDNGEPEPQASPLKTLEDMLHNKIKQKKEQVHKTKNIAETDRICREID